MYVRKIIAYRIKLCVKAYGIVILTYLRKAKCRQGSGNNLLHAKYLRDFK